MDAVAAPPLLSNHKLQELVFLLVSYKCYFTDFAHSRECSPPSHLWISITAAAPDPLVWSSFSERRLNEGEPANGLSSIQSETKQLACDGYLGGNINSSDRVGKCGSRRMYTCSYFGGVPIF